MASHSYPHSTAAPHSVTEVSDEGAAISQDSSVDSNVGVGTAVAVVTPPGEGVLAPPPSPIDVDAINAAVQGSERDKLNGLYIFGVFLSESLIILR